MFAKNFFYSVFLVVGAVIVSGCASIVSDSKYAVNITSYPENAHVSLKNKKGVEIYNGTTPATINLKSGSGYFSPEQYTVTVSKEGYHKRTMSLDGSFDAWYVGNVVFGGLIGALVIDPMTGAMWELPAALSTSLSKVEQGTTETS